MKNRFGFYFAHFSAMLNKHLSKATQCVGLVRKLPRITKVLIYQRLIVTCSLFVTFHLNKATVLDTSCFFLS